MVFSIFTLAGALAALPAAFAGFDAGSKSNMAVYWGQNSFGQGSGPNVQERLSYYCDKAEFDVSLRQGILERRWKHGEET